MNDLSTQMATETKNAAVATLYLRLKRYLRHFTDCSVAEAHRVLVDLFKPESTSQAPYLLHLRSLFDVVPTKSAVEADPEDPPAGHAHRAAPLRGRGGLAGARASSPSCPPSKASGARTSRSGTRPCTTSSSRLAWRGTRTSWRGKRLYWSRLFDVERFERKRKVLRVRDRDGRAGRSACC